MWRAIAGHRTRQLAVTPLAAGYGYVRAGAARGSGPPQWSALMVWHRPFAAVVVSSGLDRRLVWTKAHRSRRRRVVWPVRLSGPAWSLMATNSHGMEAVGGVQPP